MKLTPEQRKKLYQRIQRIFIELDKTAFGQLVYSVIQQKPDAYFDPRWGYFYARWNRHWLFPNTELNQLYFADQIIAYAREIVYYAQKKTKTPSQDQDVLSVMKCFDTLAASYGVLHEEALESRLSALENTLAKIHANQQRQDDVLRDLHYDLKRMPTLWKQQELSCRVDALENSSRSAAQDIDAMGASLAQVKISLSLERAQSEAQKAIGSVQSGQGQTNRYGR